MRPAQKTCPICLVSKNVEQFHKDKSTKDGLFRYCKECSFLKGKEKRIKNRKKYSVLNPYDGNKKVCPSCGESLTRNKKNWTVDFYNSGGLRVYCNDCRSIFMIKRRALKEGKPFNPPLVFTGKEARELKKKQKEKCYVCGRLEGERSLHLDHSHYSGRIRGFACYYCNYYELPKLDYLCWKYPEIRRGVMKTPELHKILYDPPAKHLYK